MFTGGSLLFGTTGRTDLLGEQHARTLAHRQHASARRLADLLPDGAQIWPTHGFGSFCSATQSDAAASTIGREKQANPVLRLEADAFVTRTLAGLDAYPAYYAHMGARNSAGAGLIDLTPAQPADAEQLRERIAAGEWVVDLRSRKAFAARHLTGTVSFGLDGPMATWLAWLAPGARPSPCSATTPSRSPPPSASWPASASTARPRPRPAPPRLAGGEQTRLTTLATATFADLAAARAAASHAICPPPTSCWTCA
nr:hypothetical protein GCM10020093_017250 [Planobispora longispora]